MPDSQNLIEGKYQVLEKIKDGGMGSVYRVRHLLLDEIRVIKVIHPRLGVTADLSDRFLHEARAASRLRHPNIAQLQDFAVGDDGKAFIVMEYIDGSTFEEILRRSGPPPLGLALEAAQQALKAIGYLHRRGFVHRDISPDNLMLTRDVDGGALVKLIDLGVAKILTADRGLTGTGMFLGKPRYASPEQLGAAESVDGRSDLYSFGIVLYELLTGRCPFSGPDAQSLMASHLFRPPLDFADSDPAGKLPPDLREIVLAALAKRREDRIQSAEDFSRRLTAVQSGFSSTSEDLARTLPPLASAAGRNALEPPPQWTEPLPPAQTSEEPAAEWAKTGAITRAITREITRPGSGEETAPPVLPDEALPSPGDRRRSPAWLLPAALVLLAASAGGTWWYLQTSRTGATREATEAAPAESRPALVEEHQEEIPDGRVAAASEGAVGAEEKTTAAPEPEPRRSSPAAPEPVATPVETAPPVRRAAEPEPGKPERRSSGSPPAASVAVPVEIQGERRSGAERAPMKPGDLISSGDEGVEDPRPLSVPQAAYPPAAAESGVRTRVVVSVLIDETGKVINVDLQQRDNSGLGFNEAAVEAARQARFQPATRNGVPGRTWGDLTFDFGPPEGRQ